MYRVFVYTDLNNNKNIRPMRVVNYVSSINQIETFIQDKSRRNLELNNIWKSERKEKELRKRTE